MTPAKKTKPKKQKKSAPKNHLVSVVLLSENYGYRMKSCGPISLVKVGNHTLLEHQLDAIKRRSLIMRLSYVRGSKPKRC